MRRPEFLAKADVSPIIRGHVASLSNARTGQPSLSDKLFFFGTPFCVGIILVGVHFHFRSDAVSGFLNAFSILTGLLLNLLVLVFSLSVSQQKETQSTVAQKLQQLRKRILKEVFTNVCYCILISICVVGTALVDLSYMRSQPGATTGMGSTFLLSALTCHFVLTLLMVMKRMYRLISTEFDITSSTQKAA